MNAAVAQWWRGLSDRERLLIAVLGALALAAALLLLVVRPINAARAEAQADIQTHATLTARLRALSPGAARPGVAQLAGPPATIVQTAAGQAGVAVMRSEPDGARTRAIVEEARYDAAMAWLALLDAQAGVRIVEARLTRRPTPGMVGVVLVFQS